MPLGYSNIHRPQAVSRSVSFGVVEPYIETSSLTLGKSPSSSNMVQTAATFPSRNRRLICRSHSTDEAYLCSRLSADILSDTTNTEDSSTDRSATPFATLSALPSSSLGAFSSANQESRDGATTEMVAISGDNNFEQTAQENDEDAVFRSFIFESRMAVISRLEPTIGEASDEEDDQDDEEEEYFKIRQSAGGDSHSRQGSSPSLLCLKRANPVYDGPIDDSDSETGSTNNNGNNDSWPCSEFESPAKRSRKNMMAEDKPSPYTYEHDRVMEATNSKGGDEASVVETPATTTTLTTPALYFRAEDISSSSTVIDEVIRNDDQQHQQHHHLMATQSLEADEVEGYNISAIFASAE